MPGKNLTQTQAERVYRAIVKRYHMYEVTAQPVVSQGTGTWPGGQPVLCRDFESMSGSTIRWAIVWEEGPYEWAYDASENTRDLPGVFTEPVNTFTLGLYPA
jgi:hypothetical protein